MTFFTLVGYAVTAIGGFGLALLGWIEIGEYYQKLSLRKRIVFFLGLIAILMTLTLSIEIGLFVRTFMSPPAQELIIEGFGQNRI